jgi:hypothetical protein
MKPMTAVPGLSSLQIARQPWLLDLRASGGIRADDSLRRFAGRSFGVSCAPDGTTELLDGPDDVEIVIL